MRAFSDAWLLPITWQRRRSHRSIRRNRKPHATRNLVARVFHRSKVSADLIFIYTLPETGVSTFFAPVTLTFTRWPSYTILTRIPLRCTGGEKNELPMSRLSKVVWQTDIQTTSKLYTWPLRGWSNVDYGSSALERLLPVASIAKEPGLNPPPSLPLPRLPSPFLSSLRSRPPTVYS